VRPPLAREEGSASCVSVEDIKNFPREPPPQRLTVHSAAASVAGNRVKSAAVSVAGNRVTESAEFLFDRVFQPATQLEICAQVAGPLVGAVLEGSSNATLFAYGQTGAGKPNAIPTLPHSGKTFTMEGPPGHEGIIPFAVREVFKRLPPGLEVHMQYVQLYNSDFLDLFSPKLDEVAGGKEGWAAVKLSVAEGARSTHVAGASLVRFASADAALKQIRIGASFRATGATNMNDASSRSHAVLTLFLAPPGTFPPDHGTALFLVDLAGSERTKRSGATGQRFTEAAAINTALSALGRVVLGLVERDGSRPM
ncbi:P-loop containing nucleoside triphosphate hydrolase protein, partial [Baffinella frigidus]